MKKFIFISIFLTFTACDDKGLNTKEEINNNSENDDGGEACLEDSDCTAEDPEFSFNPGGFEPICYENDQGGHKCIECFNNEDCGDGNRCKNETYCIGVDD